MKVTLLFILFLLPTVAICQTTDTIAPQFVNCTYFYFDEVNSEYNDTNLIKVPIEELTLIPPPSKTLVSYIHDYTIEKDSLGRVCKLIENNFNDNTTEETTYIYDSDNRLIREDILIDNRFSGQSNYSYRKEQIHYSYLPNGKVKEKTRILIGSPANFLMQKWTFSY